MIHEFYVRLFEIKNLFRYSEFHHLNLFFKAFHSDYSYIDIQCSDQNSKPLEIEDIINLTLVINWYRHINIIIIMIIIIIIIIIIKWYIYVNLENKYMLNIKYIC